MPQRKQRDPAGSELGFEDAVAASQRMKGGWGADSRRRMGMFAGIVRSFCLFVDNCNSQRTFRDPDVVKELSSTTSAVQYLLTVCISRLPEGVSANQ